MRILALIMMLGLTACVSHEPAGVTVLRYASPYSPNHPFSKADRAWMEWVNQRSQGRIQITPYWSGSLLSSEQSMTELRHGVADIGLITPIYARGGAHLIRVQAGFYGGATRFEQQTAIYRCLAEAEPEFQKEMRGLRVLAVQGGNLPGIITRDRIVTTLDDLKGLRLRAPSELLEVLHDLGADPVDMPMGEVYSALAKGVLDGVVAPADTLKSLHFAEVAHYFNTIAIPRGGYPARAIGERRWQTLREADRQVLEDSTAIWEAALAHELAAANIAGAKFGRESGVVFSDIAANEQRRFEEIYARDGQARAHTLDRFGINGVGVFEHAREVTKGIAERGVVECKRSARGPAT